MQSLEKPEFSYENPITSNPFVKAASFHAQHCVLGMKLLRGVHIKKPKGSKRVERDNGEVKKREQVEASRGIELNRI